MKYKIYILITISLVIILLITKILKSRFIEPFENTCSQENCKAPNLWFNNHCFATCPEGTTPSEKTPISCVHNGDDGTPLPFYTGSIRTPITQC